MRKPALAENQTPKLACSQLSVNHLKIGKGNREKGGSVLRKKGQLTRFKELEGRDWAVDPELITPMPGQPRMDFDEEKMAELKDSISRNGQDTAITVATYKDSKSGKVKFLLADGERRLRAITELEMSEISANVKWFESEGEIFKYSFRINSEREGHNEIEIANAYKKMMIYAGREQGLRGMQAIEYVAKDVGVSVTTITNQMELLKLDPEIQEQVASGMLPKSKAVEIAKTIEQVRGKLDQKQLSRIISETSGLDAWERTQKIQAGLKKALVAGGTSRKKAEQMETEKEIATLVGQLGKTRKACAALLEKNTADVIKALKERGGYTPDTIESIIQEVLNDLREVYTKCVRPATR
jgi:ParB/RepB/Spo0J family partition protein